ncbi:MAG: DUF1904 domain-containing protein [Bacilli bacterium]|jgi:serine/threonine protein phosphatase PrpC|nr:DUF1904 domain-containing protein [Bacilli bacterium]
MPHIILHNISTKDAISLSQEILSDLSLIVDVPEDWFEFNCLNSQCIVENEIDNKSILVYIDWFKRKKDIQDQVALLMNKALAKRGYRNITIYFRELTKDNYYENMNQF